MNGKDTYFREGEEAEFLPRDWTPEEKELIAWFEEAMSRGVLPSKPFELSCFSITSPSSYYDSITRETKGHMVARTLRAVKGAAAYDMRLLREYVEGGTDAPKIMERDLFPEADDQEGSTERGGKKTSVCDVPDLFE